MLLAKKIAKLCPSAATASDAFFHKFADSGFLARRGGISLFHCRPIMSALIRWFVAKTKPGQSAVAVVNLQRQSFDAYAPQCVIERASKGRITRTREPLFPNYVLVQFALSLTAWRSINSTRGVNRLVSFSEDGTPSALPDGEVEKLKQREKSGDLFISEVIRLRRGDRVRVAVGNATDALGDVVRTRGERVELLLNLLGARVRCIAPQHTLHLVERATPARSAVAIGPKPYSNTAAL